jgi:ribosome-associated translation inhibitor RaiA
MKLKITYDGAVTARHDGLDTLVSDWAQQHLEPLMQGIGYAESELSVVINQQKKGAGKWVVKLHMHVPPRKIIAVHGQGAELKPALDAALKRLLRKVERHVSRVRHQETYKRKARRARLRELKTRMAALPAEVASEASGSIESLLPRLQKAIRRELAYLRSQGDLSPDYPTEQDVLDEVVAQVQSDWPAGIDSHAAYLKLLQAMHNVLDKEVRSGRLFGEMASLESVPPADAEDQAEAMVEEEVQEFWQPDELLRLEDVISDVEAIDPEVEAEAAEEAEEEASEAAFMLALMKDLPILWRRALMLQTFERLVEEELAELFEADVASVTVWIDAANGYLAARAQEAGFEVPADRPLSVLEQGTK